ncbi:MAG: TraR/DksA C4-type zinc finger protein [Bacteroidales bacterium]|nr:TraR/DksA C4-type zinc finger protein [Bacteroidales bacterium]
MMKEKEKMELEHIIREEIRKLEFKINDLKDFTAPIAPDNAIGRISRMDAINNKSIFEASERNLQNRLSLLNQSLQFINDPDFGVCIKCRQTIAMERLKIRPEIRYCAECLKK